MLLRSVHAGWLPVWGTAFVSGSRSQQMPTPRDGDAGWPRVAEASADRHGAVGGPSRMRHDRVTDGDEHLIG
jgi:hypothetical protein